jgi:hypothetical protein
MHARTLARNSKHTKAFTSDIQQINRALVSFSGKKLRNSARTHARTHRGMRFLEAREDGEGRRVGVAAAAAAAVGGVVDCLGGQQSGVAGTTPAAADRSIERATQTTTA